MGELSFDVASLLEEAAADTGLSDFGPEDFREGLRVLCETYAGNPFNEKGRRRSHRRLLQLLSTRLRIQQALKKHPEIAQREIRAPMVLTGLPRSGTSALFNLLASDPATRPLRLWETQFPEPLDDLPPGTPDPRRAAMEAHYARGREKNPGFTKIHFASADTPEECVLLHAYALGGVQLGIEGMLEPYGSWFRKQDQRPLYAYYADLLRMLDWQRSGERWLLKAPAHMWSIDVLIETFPDVSIVWTHREPAHCIASICSMTRTMMEPQLDVDARQLGPLVMDFYATSLERGLRTRERCDPARFIDVRYDELDSDPIAIVEQIYARFGLAFRSEVRASLEAHRAENPKGQHGDHEYALDEFGLTIDRIEERFARYASRFEVPLT